MNLDSKSGPDSGNQTVKIILTNGATINFVADWNHGLQVFMSDHEAYMRGGRQAEVTYQMQSSGKKENNHLNLKFESIAAIHLHKVTANTSTSQSATDATKQSGKTEPSIKPRGSKQPKLKGGNGNANGRPQ